MKNYNEYITEAKKSTEHPFIQAAKNGNLSTVKTYIKEGKVDINMKNEKEKRTALMYASMEKFLLVVDTLLQAGANPNLGDFDNRTALMMSATMKTVDLLLKYNADVNIQSYKGDTTIMEYLNYYSWSGAQMVSMLEKFLEKGLDLDIKNLKGQNFYEKLKDKQESARNAYDVERFLMIEEFMNKKFPQYKEEWNFNRNVKSYNL